MPYLLSLQPDRTDTDIYFFDKTQILGRTKTNQCYTSPKQDVTFSVPVIRVAERLSNIHSSVFED